MGVIDGDELEELKRIAEGDDRDLATVAAFLGGLKEIAKAVRGLSQHDGGFDILSCAIRDAGKSVEAGLDNLAEAIRAREA